MSSDWNFLTDQALALPIPSRVELAKRLIDSLDGERAVELHRRWADVAGDRWHEIESGQVECLDSDEVLRKAREHLQ